MVSLFTMFSISRSPFSSSLRAALLIGIGIVAAIDEIVFHQLLPYDLVWDLAGGLLLLVGSGLWWRARTAFR